MAKLGLNKVMLIGNLGADPEVRSLDSGAKVATLRLATTETYMDRNGARQERTEWHRVNMWRGLADTAERFLKKGATIYVEGRITTRSWDGEGGKKNYSTEIEATNMIMLGGGGGGFDNSGGFSQSGQTSRPAQENPVMSSFPGNDPGADDLPF